MVSRICFPAPHSCKSKRIFAFLYFYNYWKCQVDTHFKSTNEEFQTKTQIQIKVKIQHLKISQGCNYSMGKLNTFIQSIFASTFDALIGISLTFTHFSHYEDLDDIFTKLLILTIVIMMVLWAFIWYFLLIMMGIIMIMIIMMLLMISKSLMKVFIEKITACKISIVTKLPT